MSLTNSQSISTLTKIALGAATGIALAVVSGCSTNLSDIAPQTTISPKLAGEISRKGFRQQDAVLVRIFKEESELEVWKKKSNGQYALF